MRGDFVTRGMPVVAVESLDAWLQDGMAVSRDMLGASWLDLYLTSPVWHFAMDEGLAGPQPLTGLMIPSVDAVGRYFPLMVTAPLPDRGGLFWRGFAPSRWRQAAETVALSALEDATTLASLEAAIAALDVPVPEETGIAVRACLGLGERTARARHGGPLSVWWTAGSDQVAPGLLATAALPVPEAFAGLLDGDWPRLEGLGITVFPVEEG